MRFGSPSSGCAGRFVAAAAAANVPGGCDRASLHSRLDARARRRESLAPAAERIGCRACSSATAERPRSNTRRARSARGHRAGERRRRDDALGLEPFDGERRASRDRLVDRAHLVEVDVVRVGVVERPSASASRQSRARAVARGPRQCRSGRRSGRRSRSAAASRSRASRPRRVPDRAPATRARPRVRPRPARGALGSRPRPRPPRRSSPRSRNAARYGPRRRDPRSNSVCIGPVSPIARGRPAIRARGPPRAQLAASAAGARQRAQHGHTRRPGWFVHAARGTAAGAPASRRRRRSPKPLGDGPLARVEPCAPCRAVRDGEPARPLGGRAGRRQRARTTLERIT